MDGGGADVAVPFEDFFGGYVGGGVEEGGIVEDGLQVFGYLPRAKLATLMIESDGIRHPDEVLKEWLKEEDSLHTSGRYLRLGN